MRDVRGSNPKLPLTRQITGFGAGARSLVANASYLGAAFLLTYAVRTLYVLVLARILGPELYGMFAYGQSWYVTFLPLALFGVGSVLGRELGRDGLGARPIVEASLSLRLVSVFLAALGCVAIGWWSAPTAEYRLLLAVFSLALAGRGIALWSHHVFVGVERSQFTLQQDRLFRPLEAAVGLGLVYLGHGVLSLAVVHAAVWWLQAAQGIHLVRANVFPVVPRWEGTRLLALTRSGAPIALGGVLAGWMLTGPLILYARQAGVAPDMVGQLALAMQICSVLYGFMLSASNAAVPVLSRSVARADGKDVSFLWVTAAAALVLGGGASLLGAYAGPWLVRFAFGAGFAPAGDLLAAAFALLIPLTTGSAAFQVLVVRGRVGSLVVSTGLGAIVFSAMLPWLVSRQGLMGPIVAAGIGAVFWAATSLVWAHGASRQAVVRNTGIDDED